MVSLIDDAYIHPGLSDLHDEAAGNEIRPERFWKQLSNLSNAIIKVVIDEAMMEQLLYPALGTYSGFCFMIFFIWKITLFQGVKYPCVCKLSRLTLNVWLHVFTKIRYTILTLISIFLTKYQTIRFSQRNYYNIWNANISGKKVK